MSIQDKIAAVRDADERYRDESRVDETHDGVLWNEKRDARRSLRESIAETLGVNIDELKQLTQG